jgi:hypothetical protein
MMSSGGGGRAALRSRAAVAATPYQFPKLRPLSAFGFGRGCGVCLTASCAPRERPCDAALKPPSRRDYTTKCVSVLCVVCVHLSTRRLTEQTVGMTECSPARRALR